MAVTVDPTSVGQSLLKWLRPAIDKLQPRSLHLPPKTPPTHHGGGGGGTHQSKVYYTEMARRKDPGSFRGLWRQPSLQMNGVTGDGPPRRKVFSLCLPRPEKGERERKPYPLLLAPAPYQPPAASSCIISRWVADLFQFHTQQPLVVPSLARLESQSIVCMSLDAPLLIDRRGEIRAKGLRKGICPIFRDKARITSQFLDTRYFYPPSSGLN